jgi:hypothetical protein
VQKLSPRERTWSQFEPEIQRKESNGHNSQWRTHEVTRTVGSSEAAGWLGVGKTHHFGFRNQRGPSIIISLSCWIIIINLGIVSLEDRPNIFGFAKS